MNEIREGIKAIVRKDDWFLVLVEPDGSFDLPGGRVETGETNKSALHREIDKETNLKVKIQDPVVEWSFLKQPDLLIKGITFACDYLGGKVRLCAEHKYFFWAGIGKINQLERLSE